MNKEEKRKELLSKCKYYKGEDDANSDLAFYEQMWIEFNFDRNTYLKDITEEYKQRGLEHFSEDDGVPISLKAVFYNRLTHWSPMSTNEDFKEWYKTYYLRLDQ